MKTKKINHQAVLNCCQYLCAQPTLAKPNGAKLVVVFEPQYQALCDMLAPCLSEAGPHLLVCMYNTEAHTPDTVIPELHDASLALFMYDKYSGSEIHVNYSDTMKPYGEHIENNPMTCSFLIDVLSDFNDIFDMSPKRTISLNQELIQLAEKTQYIHVADAYGSQFQVHLGQAKTWFNMDGTTHQNILPSEIASYKQPVNGVWYFTGTLLSKVPFSLKYGVIKEPIKLVIKDGSIMSCETQHTMLQDDLDYFFDAHPNHRSIEEIGIGTNEGLTKLTGSNAPHEERHAGLHIGLGGEAKGSTHVDFISDACHFYFDDRLVFDGKFRI